MHTKDSVPVWNEIVVLKALLMGIDVQMRGLDLCIAGEGLSLIGEEGDILPFEIPFSTFLAWCNEMPEEDIVILQMNIILNEEKNKNIAERNTAGKVF